MWSRLLRAVAFGIDNTAAQQQASQLSYLLPRVFEPLSVHHPGSSTSSARRDFRHALDEPRALFARAHCDPERPLYDIVLIGEE